MNTADHNTIRCNECRESLADLLFDPPAAGARAGLEAHLAACAACQAEFDELRATMALLDAWQAPEPSPFFDTRLKARLREAEAEAPSGFWAAVKARWHGTSSRGLRPAMAGAFALALIVGGGTLVNFHSSVAPQHAAPSATVNDLQILDNNALALQQMDQLLDGSGQANQNGGGGPTT